MKIGNAHADSKDVITRGGRIFVVVWAIGLIALALVVGYFVLSDQSHNKMAAIARHNSRIDPNLTEAGQTAADATLPPGVNPVQVTSGIYLDRIAAISIRDNTWTADFYIWFSWKGDAVKPGENFQIVDGWIESKEKEKTYTQGDEHYELYRVVAPITKFFDVSRFPRDDHLMTINIENPEYLRTEMVFIPDTKNSNVSSRVKIPGYSIHKNLIVEKPHSYKSTRGDPRLPEDYRATASQIRYGLWLGREDYGFYLRMFQGLYLALAVALIAFFIKPTDVDPRFGLAVGAIFAAMANAYITAGLIPPTGVMTLADVVNGLGLAMIFLSLVESAISLYVYDILGMQALSRLFDRVSFFILLTATTTINVAIPLVASI